MRLWVNDEPHDVPDGTTIRALLAELGLSDAAVAVAVEQQFVPRSEHERHALAEGARVEILAPMQGG